MSSAPNVSAKATTKTKKRRHSATGSHFNSYIHSIWDTVKKTTPQAEKFTISDHAVAMLSNLCHNLSERIGGNAGDLARLSGRHTLSDKDIVAALKMEVPDALAVDAEACGTKAVARYLASEAEVEAPTESV